MSSPDCPHADPVRPRCPGVCRSCGRTRTLYRRGLCHRCYTDPEIRPLFPSPFPGGDRFHPDAEGEASSALCPPTDAPPGSEGKIAAMEARFAVRQPLFHRGDAGSDLT